MSKHDLQARPIYHRTRDSIEAHLSVAFAVMAVSHWIEHQTGWSIKKFVRTARRYRTIEIQAGGHTITAADPLPDDLGQIHQPPPGGPRQPEPSQVTTSPETWATAYGVRGAPVIDNPTRRDDPVDAVGSD